MTSWRSLFMFLVLTGCTEPNPGYRPEPDSGACTLGQRVCSGNNAMVCVPRPEPAHLELERSCPAPSACLEGTCTPPPDACQVSCPDNLVCTLFVVPGAGRLATYCATAVGDKAGGVPCLRNEECQSGFCLRGGRTPVCYRPCGKSNECGAGTTLRCAILTVTVNGFQGTTPACVPGP